MGKQLDLPISNAYWVVEGKLMAGEYPGHSNVQVARERLRSLMRIGIQSFIDLTSVGDSNHPYQELLFSEAEELGLEVQYFRFPINDFRIPSRKRMKSVLDKIDNELKNNHPVYLHCLAGIGRTGTTVGCYLVRSGMRGDEALEQIRLLRAETGNFWHQSPETSEQIEFIRNWEKGW